MQNICICVCMWAVYTCISLFFQLRNTVAVMVKSSIKILVSNAIFQWKGAWALGAMTNSRTQGKNIKDELEHLVEMHNVRKWPLNRWIDKEDVESTNTHTKWNVQFSSVQSLSRVRLFATPWITARQASLSITNSQSLHKPMSIESVMPSSHLILCCRLLLLPPIPPSIRVFSNESTLCMRWPKYWSFSFNIALQWTPGTNL